MVCREISDRIVMIFLIGTSLINCLVLTCGVSFFKADSRNEWSWHCWM